MRETRERLVLRELLRCGGAALRRELLDRLGYEHHDRLHDVFKTLERRGVIRGEKVATPHRRGARPTQYRLTGRTAMLYILRNHPDLWDELITSSWYRQHVEELARRVLEGLDIDEPARQQVFFDLCATLQHSHTALRDALTGTLADRLRTTKKLLTNIDIHAWEDASALLLGSYAVADGAEGLVRSHVAWLVTLIFRHILARIERMLGNATSAGILNEEAAKLAVSAARASFWLARHRMLRGSRLRWTFDPLLWAVHARHRRRATIKLWGMVLDRASPKAKKAIEEAEKALRRLHAGA